MRLLEGLNISEAVTHARSELQVGDARPLDSLVSKRFNADFMTRGEIVFAKKHLGSRLCAACGSLHSTSPWPASPAAEGIRWGALGKIGKNVSR